MVEIKNEIQYERIIERIEELLKLVDNDTPLTDKNMVELELLSLLVVEYEEKNYPIEPPTLIEMVQERMAEMKLSQKELAELLGISPPRISEYLNGKSEPTLKVARLMHQKLDIDPEILLG
ncbi:MAG: helix-turn-helix domain-containing protein [Bacteroidales bacterium]|nr:helix-turn-helix domain-containing protein [Bacteroidales bacterium]